MWREGSWLLHSLYFFFPSGKQNPQALAPNPLEEAEAEGAETRGERLWEKATNSTPGLELPAGSLGFDLEDKLWKSGALEA